MVVGATATYFGQLCTVRDWISDCRVAGSKAEIMEALVGEKRAE